MISFRGPRTSTPSASNTKPGNIRPAEYRNGHCRRVSGIRGLRRKAPKPPLATPRRGYCQSVGDFQLAEGLGAPDHFQMVIHFSDTCDFGNGTFTGLPFLVIDDYALQYDFAVIGLQAYIYIVGFRVALQS